MGGRTAFVEDPGLGILEGDEELKVKIRCQDRHPGYCKHLHEPISSRVDELGNFSTPWVQRKMRSGERSSSWSLLGLTQSTLSSSRVAPGW